jgi:hypothetical protein
MRQPARLVPRVPFVAFAGLLLGAVAPTAHAQGLPSATAAPRASDWMVSVNPLGLLAGGLTGEAERRLADARTAAASVNYWGAFGAQYLSVDAKFRFYHRRGTTPAPAPARAAGDAATARASDFAGLSYGPMVGFQRISFAGCEVVDGERCAATGLTAGGTVDYGWRVGREQAVALLVGGGVKTGFGFGGLGADGDGPSPRITYPFVRLGVGYLLPTRR